MDGRGDDADEFEYAYDLEDVDGAASADDAGEEGWRFDLDEVTENGIVTPAIEAGDPDPEHALFVALGALATVLVVVRLWLLV